MNVEIIQSGRVLRTHHHNGQSYAEAPVSGEYEVRLTNTSPKRRCAVLSVDGLNVIDGKDAGFDGSGYVLGGFQSVTVKGFLRSESECARFTFAASTGSYTAQTGRGTKNTGVIGVAVFDEKEKPVLFQPPPVIIKEEHHHHHYPRKCRSSSPPPSPFWYGVNGNSNTVTLGGSEVYGSTGGQDGMSFSCSTEAVSAKTPQSLYLNAPVQTEVATAVDLGTAYGKAEAFFTTTTTFERSTPAPVAVLTLRYGTKEKLKEWGVPVDVTPAQSEAPTAFPASRGYAQPPAGWVR